MFSHPRMIEEMLREFIAERWVETLDFSTLERVNADFVTEGLKGREGDLIWKLRRRDGRAVYLYLMVEFQSKVDRFMAVRLMGYESLLYQELITRSELSSDGRLPLILPIVLYNGVAEWSAPTDLAELIDVVEPELEPYLPRLRYKVIDEGSYSAEELRRRESLPALLFWFEKNRKREDLQWGVQGLVQRLDKPEDAGLRRAFMVWVTRVLPGGRKVVEQIPEVLGLEEFQDMLEKTVLEWNEELREEGRQEGLREGLQKGLQKGEAKLLIRQLELKFGPLDEETRNRVLAAEPDRLLEWGERILKAPSLADLFGD